MQVSDDILYTKQNSIKIAYATCFTRIKKAGFVQVLNMCNALSANGAELKLFAGFTNQKMCTEDKQALNQFLSFANGLWDFRQQSYLNNSSIRFSPNSLVALLRYYSHAMAVLRAKLWQPDIFYTREYPHAVIANFLNMPVVLEIHQSKTGYMPASRLQSIAQLAQKRKKIILVPISQQIAEDLNEVGAPASNIVVLPSAAPSAKAYSTSKEQARSELNIALSSKIVTYTGNLHEGKGVNDLINAAPKLPDIQFLIVGGEEIVGLNTAKSLAASIGASNIKFIGTVPPDKVPLFQLASDVLVATLYDELSQSPLKIVEYAAARRPMVVTNTKTMYNHLTNQTDALFYKLGDADDLAAQISVLLANPNLGKSLSENAFKRLGHWTWDDRAIQVLNFIKSKLKQNP